MNTGFHSSCRHAPNSALLRALWTHAPSSCQTTPTVGVPRRIGRGANRAEDAAEAQDDEEQRANRRGVGVMERREAP